MKIRRFRDLINRIYTVRVRTEDWGQEDLRRMHQYGEPEIDLGGSFVTVPSAVDGTPLSFTLPTRHVKLYSDTNKIYAEFDARDFEFAKDMAIAWDTEIQTRIAAVLDTLRQQPLDFNAELVTTSGVGDFQAEMVKQI